jgi:hypothetical protein
LWARGWFAALAARRENGGVSVVFYGAVSGETEKVIEFFLTSEEAEGFIAAVEGDEPETAARLRVKSVEFEHSVN